jgi:hypothetical protein
MEVSTQPNSARTHETPYLPSFRSTSCKEISSSIEDLEATFSLATNAIHMDDRYAGPDVAPAMHPSTT